MPAMGIGPQVGFDVPGRVLGRGFRSLVDQVPVEPFDPAGVELVQILLPAPGEQCELRRRAVVSGGDHFYLAKIAVGEPVKHIAYLLDSSLTVLPTLE